MMNDCKFLPVFLFLILLTACGSGSNKVDATTVSAITTVPFTVTEVLNKTIYLASATEGKVTSEPVTGETLDGGVLLRGAKEIVAIQKEVGYWLVYDRKDLQKKISRLYLDETLATAYLLSISAGINKTHIGGTIQGTELPLAATVETLAGTAGTKGAVNDTGAAASFNQPLGITTLGADLYVADYNNNIIRKITDKKVSTVNAIFSRPTAITSDGKDLYVADSLSSTIKQIVFSNNSTVVTTIAGLEGTSGAIDAVKDKARFNDPSGITTDGTNLYVTDSYHTIRKIVISSGAVSTLAGTAGSAGSADGIGAAARFNLPTGITTDGSSLYVTDFNNRTIRRISIATGEVKTIVGNADLPAERTDPTGRIGTSALFNQLNGITTDGTNLYVTDAYNNAVYKINKTSLLVTKLAGVIGLSGSKDSVDGPPTFNAPTGITTDGTSLYITDSQNHTLRKIQ